jgi:CRP-like cAMP-binding protein
MSPPEASNRTAAMTSFAFLQRLSVDHRQRLLEATTTRTYASGEHLWTQDAMANRFHAVVSGHVKLTRMDPQGRETTITIESPGHFLCPMQAYAHTRYQCSATAVGATQVLSFDRKVLLCNLREHSEVALSFVDSMLKSDEALRERINELSALRVVERVARLFVRLAETIGVHTSEGTVLVPVRLSRRELASLCATTPETICRQLRRAPISSLVSTHKGGFTLHALDALRDVADGGTGLE